MCGQQPTEDRSRARFIEQQQQGVRRIECADLDVVQERSAGEVIGTPTRQLARLLAPRLLPGEEILGNGAAWFAPVPEKSRLLFVGRHYHWVALTDQRLVVFERKNRNRRATPLLDVPLGSLRLVRAGAARVLFPVRVEGSDGRAVVLEFRPRQRAFGQAIATALRARGWAES